MRIVLLTLLLCAELALLTTHYAVPTLLLPALDTHITWAAQVLHFSKAVWRMGLWITAACVVVLSPRWSMILTDFRDRPGHHSWWAWLLGHFATLAGFVTLTAHIFARPTDPAAITALSVTAWFVLAGMVLLLWLLALAPIRFWLRFVRQHHIDLTLACLLGGGGWAMVEMLTLQEAPLAQRELWNTLANPTLELVYLMIGWFHSDLVYDPEALLVGTSAFPVTISYACSGTEGISLIIVFLGLYFWLFRASLRFPQAFWLLPIGIVAIWLANAGRIVALILIGTHLSPEVALAGFHAQAGWIAFTGIAVGAIALIHNLRFFTLMRSDGVSSRFDNRLAAALIIPFLALMAAAMVSAATSDGFRWLYPLRVLAAGAVLGYFREYYRSLGWSASWESVLIGVTVFLIWILLEPEADHANSEVVRGIAELPRWAAMVWLTFRVIGSVVIVPLTEELAFRGYLLRKLVADDFEKVPFKSFTWLSFIITSILFGLLHERWLAGTLAGMGYALAVYRHGRLGDAVLAHATTNALIAFCVLAQGQWSLWS